jgi:hypothetical protein
VRVVAKALGLGEMEHLSPAALRSLEDEVETTIEEHAEALVEGDSIGEWRALDARLASTKIGRLMQERHEIAEQILDMRDARGLVK